MEEKDRSLIRMLGALSTVGLVMVFASVIGLFFGQWLDAKFGTAPWLTALFFILGLIAGFRNLFMHVKQSQQELDKQHKNEK